MPKRDTRSESTENKTKPSHHIEFGKALIEVVTAPRSELGSYPENEILFRHLYVYNQDLHKLCTSFIESNPNEESELLLSIRKLDDISVRECQLHEKLITEGRFEYTEPEKVLADELRLESATLVGEVGNLATE